MKDLTVRCWKTDQPGANWPRRSHEKINVDVRTSALVIIDPWDNHHILEMQRRLRVVAPRIRRVKDLITREGGLAVLHTGGQEVASELQPVSADWSLVFPGQHELLDHEILMGFLEKHSVETPFFGGGAVNLCVMERPTGFRSSLYSDWSRQIGIIRDLAPSFEFGLAGRGRAISPGLEEDIHGPLAEAAFCEAEYYYPYGFSVTSGELLAQFNTD